MQPTVTYKERYGVLVASVIQEYFDKLIYERLLNVIKRTPIKVKLSAADSPEQHLINKINTGMILYDGQYFLGQFDARSSRIIKELGGTWDRERKGFRLSEGSLTPSLKSAISASKSRLEAINKKLLEALDEAEALADETDIAEKLTGAIDKVVDGLQIQTVKAMDALGVNYTLTHGQREEIKKEYIENMDKEIKKWSHEHIKSLREGVQQNAMDGFRAKKLEDMIEHNYGVTKNKAKFLAQQETSMFMAKFRQQRFTDAGVEFYRWDTVGDKKVRDDHKKLNNRIFQFGDPPIVDSATGRRGEPGEDFRCLPSDSRIDFVHGIEKCFRRWHRGKMAMLVTASGKTVRATPNHPVLTTRGWKPIGKLDDTDYVVNLPQQLLDASELNTNKGVPTIADIFETFRKSGLSLTFPGKPDQFHGDGSDSDIDVVGPTRSLRIANNPATDDGFGKLLLTASNMLYSALSRTKQYLMSLFLWHILRGRIASLRERLFFLKGKLAHADIIRLRDISNGNARLDKPSSDDDALKTCSLRNGKLALSGEIGFDYGFWIKIQSVMGATADRVVSLRIDDFIGHVYNLQTVLGYYTTAGVVVSNCRCIARPILKRCQKIGGEWKEMG
jgi:SPP1 gp7 family putative phage head morphogenesis protein